MPWHDNPTQSWYDIHEALRAELPRLRQRGEAARLGDAASLQTLSDDVAFMADVISVHSLAEDGVGFPILRHRGIEVSKALEQDHRRELELIYDVRRACLELRFHDDDQAVGAALERVRALLARLETELTAHLDAEDRDVLPLVEERLTPPEQGVLIVKMVSDTPGWLIPRLLAWMLGSIAPEHRGHLLRAWRAAMPKDVFAARARAIHDAADAELWGALAAEVPELAEAAAYQSP